MNYLIDIQTKIEVIACCECGTPIGMDASLMRKMRESGNNFYCPNGHSQHFTKSEVAKLREQLDAVNKRLTNKEFELIGERRAREQVEKKLRRTHTRIAKGVCPCCNRSFENLERHMQSKHPDYVDEADSLMRKAGSIKSK